MNTSVGSHSIFSLLIANKIIIAILAEERTTIIKINELLILTNTRKWNDIINENENENEYENEYEYENIFENENEYEYEYEFENENEYEI